MSRQFYKVVVCNKCFYMQRQPANRSVHHTLCSPNLALLLSLARCSSEDIETYSHRRWHGARLAMNGNMCDAPKSSPKVLFFAKNVLQEYAVGMFANLVTSRERGTVPCFLVQVEVGNPQKQ